MSALIEEKVEDLLSRGFGKEKVKAILKDDYRDRELDFYLKNIAYPEDRAKYQFVNLSLFCILLFITIKKFYFALSFGQSGMVTLLALIVPTLDLYILREIMRYRRTGYLFCLFLSAFSLVKPENRIFPEIVLMPVMVFLSGFLFARLFHQYEKNDPGKRNENMPEHKDGNINGS